MSSHTMTALRLGWALAEARGRSWPGGPKPRSEDSLPSSPPHLLPLRFQRDEQASRTATVSSLVALARRLGIANAKGLHTTLRGDLDAVSDEEWPALAEAFAGTDAYIQDQLAQDDDARANAYLLGRGLAECYWGLGAADTWETSPGASPVYLLGERRQELGRLLSRLRVKGVHELAPSVIDGSLQAWQAVLEDADWLAAEDLPTELHKQARTWYQLLVLGQDPTTVVPPGAQSRGLFYLRRSLGAFLPQVVTAVAAIVLATLAATDHLGGVDLVEVLPGGLGALGLAGLLTRGQSAAQQVLVRLRQDAYTDLVALHATSLPTPPSGELSWHRLESLVRPRMLTPPTAAPARGPARA